MAWLWRKETLFILTREQGGMSEWVIDKIDYNYKFHADKSETCEEEKKWVWANDEWENGEDAEREKVEEARMWLWWGSPLPSYSTVLSDSVLLIGHLIYCQNTF